MDNLQELFDAYLLTKPSAEKIRAATVMMIHVGKALNVATQEEVTSEYYDEITDAMDDFFAKSPQKATLDKAILAEMIGRIGPGGKLKRIFRKLLSDRDENVRQYALASLEYFGQKRPRTVLDYVDQFRRSDDDNMKMIAIELVAKMLCQGKQKNVFPQLRIWHDEDDGQFVSKIISRVKALNDHDTCGTGYEAVLKWVPGNFPEIWKQIFEADDNVT